MQLSTRDVDGIDLPFWKQRFCGTSHTDPFACHCLIFSICPADSPAFLWKEGRKAGGDAAQLRMIGYMIGD